MKHLGSHNDNWNFEEIQARKRVGASNTEQKNARKEAKIVARAEKRSERQRALQTIKKEIEDR